MSATYDALWAAVAAPNVFMLRIDQETRWITASDRKRFLRTLAGVEQLGSTCELVAVPRFFEERQGVANSAVLWVRTETGAQAEALSLWSPQPTITLRDGDTVRRTALWALTGELDPRWTLRLNKRLAHAIGTPKHHSDPNLFAFTTPGAIGQGGKQVHVEQMAPNFYSANELAGHLPDPVDHRAAWRARQEAVAA